MTLREWCSITGVRPIIPKHFNDRVVPDTAGIIDNRVDLWHLDDYVVSAVTGGSIWLHPRHVIKGESKEETIASNITK
jgi:hypothetical protein